MPTQDKDITQFVVQHAGELDENPYFYGSLLSFFVSRSEKNSKIGGLIRTLPKPENCVKMMGVLVKEYNNKSFRNVSRLLKIVKRNWRLMI